MTPIFIVGNARSGTTWLHRLLTSLFEKQFTTLHTWEILFATSVTWKLLFHGIYFLDQYIGSPLSALVLFLESLLISKSSLHQVGLQMAEEDEWLMIHISKAQLMCFFFPCGGEVLAPLISFDTLSSSHQPLSSSEKAEIFRYYKECIQRHLYAQNILAGTPTIQYPSTQRIFVSKNPSFTLRIRTLFETFPDCKVVCLLRDPMESIPSMVSYLAAVFHFFSSPRLKYPNAETLVGYCISHYIYPLGTCTSSFPPIISLLIEELNTNTHPDSQWEFLKYSELKSRLQETILRLLTRFRLPPLASSKEEVEELDLRFREEQRKAGTTPLCLHYSPSYLLSCRSLRVLSPTLCQCVRDVRDSGFSHLYTPSDSFSQLREVLRVVYEAHSFQ